jgi:branched-chain amino acid transport system ATP-binding protein
LLPLSFLPQRIKDEIDAVLQDLDLYDKKHERAGNLSGGQMRLLEIARLYLQDTKLYLLDEPTAGVSPKLKGKVIELINKIVAQDKTVIIVEHDFNFLGSFVHNFYVLNDGEVALTGDYEKIKNSTVVQELYFGG